MEPAASSSAMKASASSRVNFRRLALGEAHRSAGVAEVAVAGRLEEFEQLAHLLAGCGWTEGLTECHPRSSQAQRSSLRQTNPGTIRRIANT